MVDKVTVPTARASILWLIGEYSDRINKLAPDVLRKMAKSFPDEVCFEDFLFILQIHFFRKQSLNIKFLI
jgi:vesicle coat complex subunit